jgi:hypothetical protein
MIIHPIESFHADRQTEMRKLMLALAIMRRHLKLLHSAQTRHLYILHGSQKIKDSFSIWHGLSFISETQCVYCAVQTVSLNILQIILFL